jgi:3-hydroxyisobutyrate dehydrogenase-like beta-hydroxyacid dehydrogenase
VPGDGAEPEALLEDVIVMEVPVVPNTAVVVGLGNIGGAIARRIAQTGAPVIGVELDAERRRHFHGEVRTAATLAEVPWDEVGRVLVVVRMTGQALAVVEEIAANTREPLACHVMTTLDPAAPDRFPQIAGERLRILEQPVSGGANGAAAGTLTVLSAGPAEPADELFLRTTIAARVVPFPRYGQPTLAKLVNNAVAAYHTRTAAVLLGVAERLGLEPVTMKSVLDTSSGASAMGAMLAELADEQARLLTKDAALLAAAAGPLPSIELGDEAAFLDDLRAARRALAS